MGGQEPVLPAPSSTDSPCCPRSHKSICQTSNEPGAEQRSLFTRTESPGRAPEYCKEGKQLSSSLGRRLGPQPKLSGLVYLLSSMISLLFECFIPAQVCEGRRGGGNREPSFLSSTFFPSRLLPSHLPSQLRSVSSPQPPSPPCPPYSPSRQGLMSFYLFPGKLQRACRLLGWNTLFYMHHKRRELCKQYYF